MKREGSIGGTRNNENSNEREQAGAHASRPLARLTRRVRTCKFNASFVRETIDHFNERYR